MSALCFLASAHMENLFVGWFRPLALIDRHLKTVEWGCNVVHCSGVCVLTVTIAVHLRD